MPALIVATRSRVAHSPALYHRSVKSRTQSGQRRSLNAVVGAAFDNCETKLHMQHLPLPLALIIAVLLPVTWDITLNDGSWLDALNTYASDVLHTN
jgi:hypothetical protein